MASGTLVSRILGLVRTSLTGAAIGLGLVGDVFNGTSQLPNYLFLLISGGVLEPVIVPQITKAAKRADSKEYVDQLVTVSLVATAVLTLLATIGAPLMTLLLRLDPQAAMLTILFAYISMPRLFFYCVTTVLSQVLNARGRYGAPMWAPALNNVVAIAGLAIFMTMYGSGRDVVADWTGPMSWLLVGTSTLGIVAQALILVPPLIKDGFRWRPRWGFPAEEFAQLSRYTFWTLLALIISTIGGLVLLGLTSGMPTRAAARGFDGFVAGNTVYNYGFLIFQLPLSIISISIITALFPPMTRAWQANDQKALRRLVKQGFDLPAVFLIPATVAMIALAGPLVHVIFYGNSDTELNALVPVLIAMCFAMMPMSIQTLQQRYCFASEQGRTNLVFQVIATGVQLVIAIAWFFFGDPRHGVLVVSLAQSLAYTLLAIGFVWLARRQVGGLSFSGTLRLYVRLVLASVIGAPPGWLLASAVLLIGTSWPLQLIALLAGAFGFVALFTVVAKVMHIREYFDLLNPILRRLHLPMLG